MDPWTTLQNPVQSGLDHISGSQGLSTANAVPPPPPPILSFETLSAFLAANGTVQPAFNFQPPPFFNPQQFLSGSSFPQSVAQQNGDSFGPGGSNSDPSRLHGDLEIASHSDPWTALQSQYGMLFPPAFAPAIDIPKGPVLDASVLQLGFRNGVVGTHDRSESFAKEEFSNGHATSKVALGSVHSPMDIQDVTSPCSSEEDFFDVNNNNSVIHGCLAASLGGPGGSRKSSADANQKAVRIPAACVCCREIKRACDGKTPCSRCVERGIPDECRYVPRKKHSQKSTRKPSVPVPSLPIGDAFLSTAGSNTPSTSACAGSSGLATAHHHHGPASASSSANSASSLASTFVASNNRHTHSHPLPLQNAESCVAGSIASGSRIGSGGSANSNSDHMASSSPFLSLDHKSVSKYTFHDYSDYAHSNRSADHDSGKNGLSLTTTSYISNSASSISPTSGVSKSSSSSSSTNNSTNNSTSNSRAAAEPGLSISGNHSLNYNLNGPSMNAYLKDLVETPHSVLFASTGLYKALQKAASDTSWMASLSLEVVQVLFSLRMVLAAASSLEGTDASNSHFVNNMQIEDRAFLGASVMADPNISVQTPSFWMSPNCTVHMVNRLGAQYVNYDGKSQIGSIGSDNLFLVDANLFDILEFALPTVCIAATLTAGYFGMPFSTSSHLQPSSSSSTSSSTTTTTTSSSSARIAQAMQCAVDLEHNGRVHFRCSLKHSPSGSSEECVASLVVLRNPSTLRMIGASLQLYPITR
eukprot:ANDGO_07027.mRNA.1 hypothetical protein